MKLYHGIAVLWIAASSIAYAQEDDLDGLPPLPDFPDQGVVFSPTNPMSGGPRPLQPLEPLDTNGANQPKQNAVDRPDLPSLDNQDDFDFFQPGTQFGEMPQLPDTSAPATEETVEEEKPKPAVVQRSWDRPYSKRFNYRNQYLHSPVYSKTYDAANKHLPTAQYEADYDRATFIAAARNDVNGLRAMLEHGGRSIYMTNGAGETLVQVAARYKAHSALRYLLAKGAPNGGAQAPDGMGYYALNAGR